MLTIWKYHIQPDTTAIEMPVNGWVLTVQVQGKDTCIWVLVDPKDRIETRHFHIYGTGQHIYEDLDPVKYRYIGTFQPESQLVFHLFEEKFTRLSSQ